MAYYTMKRGKERSFSYTRSFRGADCACGVTAALGTGAAGDAASGEADIGLAVCYQEMRDHQNTNSDGETVGLWATGALL
jgi:hypothetical protein